MGFYKMKIPFGILPGHWGLKGRSRAIAKIEYEALDDYDREMKLAEFFNEDEKSILEIKLKYNKISKDEYDNQVIELITDPYLKEKQTLILLKARNEISDLEYEKELATLNQTPWFHMDVDYVNGDVEIDFKWNQYYISMLKSNGYTKHVDSRVK